MQKTPAWVLALTEDRLLVATLAEAVSSPQVTVTPLANLLWLELGKVLLYAWFEWSWVTPGGPEHQRVYFNTVREDLFWELVNTIRRTIIAQTGLPRSAAKQRREIFEDLPYKFKHLIPQRLLFRDEQVQAMVYQPTIWGRRWGLFRNQQCGGDGGGLESGSPADHTRRHLGNPQCLRDHYRAIALAVACAQRGWSDWRMTCGWL